MTTFISLLGLFGPLVIVLTGSYLYFKSPRGWIVITTAVVLLLVVCLFGSWGASNWNFRTWGGSIGGWGGTVFLWVAGGLFASMGGHSLAKSLR